MVDGISDLFQMPGSGKGKKRAQAPNPADVHAMAASLDKKSAEPSLGDLFSSQAAAVSGTASADPGDSLTPRSGRQPDRPDTTTDLAGEVADQILSGGKLQGDRINDNEVIIRVKEEILPGCLIHLVRENDCLQVRVSASDRNTLQTLVEARDALLALLEKNYNGLIRLRFHLAGGHQGP